MLLVGNRNILQNGSWEALLVEHDIPELSLMLRLC